MPVTLSSLSPTLHHANIDTIAMFHARTPLVADIVHPSYHNTKNFVINLLRGSSQLRWSCKFLRGVPPAGCG
jgi:hypothetical protein